MLLRKVAVLAVVGLILSSCGGDGEGGDGSRGVEDFTVAYSQPIGQNPYLKAIEDAMRIAVEERGATFVVNDARGDVDKQVADIDEFVTRNVDAIAFYPMLPESVGPSLNRADDSDIKLVALSYETNFKDPAAPAPPVAAQVMEDRYRVGVEQANWVSEALGGSGHVVYMGFAIPGASLEAMFDAFKATLEQDHPDVSLLERVDNPSDDAAGARPVIDAVLAKYPRGELDALVVYNEPSSLGALQALKAAGRDDDVMLVSTQLTTLGVEHVATGDFAASWDIDPVSIGVALADYAFSILRGEPQSQWHESRIVPAKLYTPETIDSYVPWDTQFERLKEEL